MDKIQKLLEDLVASVGKMEAYYDAELERLQQRIKTLEKIVLEALPETATKHDVFPF